MKTWAKARYRELLDGEINEANWPMWVVVMLFVGFCNVASFIIAGALIISAIIGFVGFWIIVLTPTTFEQVRGVLGL